jgi:hypothetical protein
MSKSTSASPFLSIVPSITSRDPVTARETQGMEGSTMADLHYEDLWIGKTLPQAVTSIKSFVSNLVLAGFHVDRDELVKRRRFE